MADKYGFPVDGDPGAFAGRRQQEALDRRLATLVKGKGRNGRNIGELTGREREVLLGIMAGKANKDIAEDLGIANGTVKVHVKHLLRKIGVANRQEAAAWARGLGEP